MYILYSRLRFRSVDVIKKVFKVQFIPLSLMFFAILTLCAHVRTAGYAPVLSDC